MGILTAIGIKKKSWQDEHNKIDRRNERITNKYKNKPNEVFYLEGKTTGAKIPYYYNADGKLVSGTPDDVKNKSEGNVNEDAIVETTTNEKINESSTNETGVVEDVSTESSGTSQEQEKVQQETETQETGEVVQEELQTTDNIVQAEEKELTEEEKVNDEFLKIEDREFVAKELYLTMSDNPELTDAELLEKFPEFEGKLYMLNHFKKIATEFESEYNQDLKKKDESTESEDTGDGSVVSESETLSTSSDNVLVKNKPIVPKQRIGAMKNPDGSESTHLMMTEQLEDGSWVSFPSLFQNEDGEWVDMSQEENWENIYQEAEKRGEVYEFGDDKESAIAFGEGSWKENLETDIDSDKIPDYLEKKEDTKTTDFDVDKFKSSLVNVEASGKVDYSLLPTDDGKPYVPGKNKLLSSAVGPYQFLYDTHKDVLKSEFGVNSKEEFIGNKEAQEGLMNYMLEDKPGRYPFMAKRLQKDYSQYMPEDMNISQLIALEHYVGHGDLRKLFARVRDEKDFNAEDIYDVVPSGQNMPIRKYLERMTPEEGMYIGMLDDKGNYKNPFDDPNLLAAAGELPEGDYTYEDEPWEPLTQKEVDIYKKWLANSILKENYTSTEEEKAVVEKLRKIPQEYGMYGELHPDSEVNTFSAGLHLKNTKGNSSAIIKAQSIFGSGDIVLPGGNSSKYYRDMYATKLSQGDIGENLEKTHDLISETEGYAINENMLGSLNPGIQSAVIWAMERDNNPILDAYIDALNVPLEGYRPTAKAYHGGASKSEISKGYVDILNRDSFGRGPSTTTKKRQLDTGIKSVSDKVKKDILVNTIIPDLLELTGQSGKKYDIKKILNNPEVAKKLFAKWNISEDDIEDIKGRKPELEYWDNVYTYKQNGFKDENSLISALDYIVNDIQEKTTRAFDAEKLKIHNEIIENYDITTRGLSSKIKKDIKNHNWGDVVNNINETYGVNISYDNMTASNDLDDLATQTTMTIYRNEVSSKEFQNKVQKKFEELKNETVTIPGSVKEGIPPSTRKKYLFTHDDKLWRMASEDILKANKYDHLDDSQGGVIDFMVEHSWRNYVENGEEFKNNYNKALNEEIKKYNSNIDSEEDRFLSPQATLERAQEEILNMINNPLLSPDDALEILRKDFDVILDVENSTLNLSPEYYKEYGKMSEKASNSAWDKHDGQPKQLALEGIDRSLPGKLYRYIMDESINPDQGIEYTDWENTQIGFWSIALDPTFILGGVGVNLGVKATSKMVQAQVTKNLIGNVRTVGVNLYRTNPTKYATIADANLDALRLAKNQKILWAERIAHGSGYASSATLLGAYEGSFAVVEQMLTHEQWETEDFLDVAGSTLHGMAVGTLLHGINAKTQSSMRKVEQYNLGKIYEYPLKGATWTTGLSAEAVAFTGIELASTGFPQEKIDAIMEANPGVTENEAKWHYAKNRLKHSYAFVTGLKGHQTAIKLVSGGYNAKEFDGRQPGVGELELKLTPDQKIDFIRTLNPNLSLKEVHKLAGDKNFSQKALESFNKIQNDIWNQAKTGEKVNKELLDMYNELPLDVLGKLVYSSTGLGLKVVDEMDAVGWEMRTRSEVHREIVNGREHVYTSYSIDVYNKKGRRITTEAYKTEAERNQALEILESGRELEYAQNIVGNNKLDLSTEVGLKELRDALNEKQLDIEMVEGVLNNPKSDITKDPMVRDVVDLVNNLYFKQQQRKTKQEKIKEADIEAQAKENLENLGVLPEGKPLIDEINKIKQENLTRETLRKEQKAREEEYAGSERTDKTYVQLEEGKMVKGPFGYTLELGKKRYGTKDGSIKEGYTSVEKNVENPYKITFEPEATSDGVIKLAEQMIKDGVVKREEVANISDANQLVELLKSKGYDGIQYQTFMQKLSPFAGDVTNVAFSQPTSRTLTTGTFTATKENINTFVGETKLQNKLKAEVEKGLNNGNLEKVEMHTDTQSFAEAFKKEYPKDKSNIENVEGFVARDGTTHFNVQKAGFGTGFHETGHHITNKIALKNPEKLKKAASEIIELIEKDPNLVNILDFVSAKEGGEYIYTDKQRSIEAIVELSAQIADGKIKLEKPGLKESIKKGYNKFLESVGLESMKIKEMDSKSAIEVVNEIADALLKGDKSLKGVTGDMTKAYEVVDPKQLKVNINPEDIKINTASEVERLKNLDKKSEDGATFNIDGSTYKKGGLVIPVVSTNVKLSELTPEAISKFVELHKDKIGNENVKVGIYKFPNQNKASIDINIVVPEGQRELGLQIGRKLNQESLFDLNTMENIKTGGTGEKTMELSSDQFKLLQRAIQLGEMPTFLGKKHVKGEYTYSDIVNKGKQEVVKEEAPLQDKSTQLNNEIKILKENYKKNISKIKGDVKAEKDAVKKVKTDLLNYIDTSPYINKTLKKSLVKQSIKVDTPKKLERFISNVEEISNKELLTSSKREITSLSKQVNKRKKKGTFGEDTPLIEDFLRVSEEINSSVDAVDMNVLSEVTKILNDLNRAKQPLVMRDKIKEVTDMAQNHINSLEAKTPTAPKTLEEIDKNLEKQLQDVGDMTIGSMMDMTSLDGINKIKTTSRRLTNLEKSLNRSWQEGVIGEAEYIQRTIQVNQLKDALKGTITEYNTQKHQLSNGILAETKIPKQKTNKAQEEIDYFINKTSKEFVDDPVFNDQILTTAVNLSNGHVPIKTIVELNNQIRAKNNGESITNLIENRVSRWGSQKVYGTNVIGIGGKTGQIGFKDVIAENVNNLNTQLAVRPLALLSDYYRSEYGQWKNKDAGAIDKHIVQPFINSFGSLTTDVNNTKKKYEKVSISNSTKAGRKKNLKIGLLLAQVERNTGDGKNVFETIFSDKKKWAQYSKEEQRMLKSIYDNLPKKEVDGMIVIDTEAALSNLTRKERKAYDGFRDLFDNNLLEKQKHANFVNGIEFVEQSNYFPHLIKGKKSELNTLNSDWTNTMFSGETKIKSDAGKARTTNEILPYEFNATILANNRTIEVLRDYHLSATINQVKQTLLQSKINSEMKVNELGESAASEASGSFSIHYDALMKRMKDAVELQLTGVDPIGFGPLNSKNLMQANYHLKLLRPGRVATEFFSENYRMMFAAERLRDYPQAFEAWGSRTNTNMMKVSGLGFNKKDRYIREDGSYGTTMENLMDFTNSPFVHKFNRHDVEYNKDLGGKPSGYIAKVNNWLLGMNDRNTMHMAFMPAFRAEFKRLTGKEFNSSEFNTNAEYRNSFKEQIKESAAIGDREAGKWKNIAVKGAGRTEIRVPFGTVKVTGRFKNSTPILTYMGSFGALEAAMFQKSMRDFMIGESASKRADGAKTAAGIFSAGVAYGLGVSAEFLLMNYGYEKIKLNNELEGMSFTNEDDRQKWLDANNAALDKDLQIQMNRLLPYDLHHYKKTGKIRMSNSLKSQTIGNAGFLMTTKYSQLGRTAMILTAYGTQQYAPSEDDVEAQNLDRFLWKEMAQMGITKENIGDFVSKTMYTSPTGDVGDIAQMYLPQIQTAMEIVQGFDEDFMKSVDIIFNAEDFDTKKGEEFIRANKEKFAVLNVLNQLQKSYLMLSGTQLPGQKAINEYVETQFNIWNVDFMSAGDLQYAGEIESLEDLYKANGVFQDIYLEQIEEDEGPMTREEKREALEEFNEKFNTAPSGEIKYIPAKEEDKYVPERYR